MTVIDSSWTDPIDSIRGMGGFFGPDIGEGELPGAYLETDGDELVVGVVEHLRFATERGDLAGVLDEDGWLTPTGMARAGELLRGYLREAGVPGADTLDVNDQSGGDEPHVDFSIRVPADRNATVGQVMDRVVHPFCAVVQNVTDPGTFGRPYLWGHLGN